MKQFLSVLSMLGLAFLLSGCPDSGMPKTPPNVPAPKAAANPAQNLIARQAHVDSTTLTSNQVPA